MSTFSINGKVMNMSGGSISIIDGNVIIDGKQVDMSGFGDAKVFNIVVQGDVEKVDGAFSSITVEGNASSVKSVSGTVKVDGDVEGNVSTVSGTVKVAGNIEGNVSTVSGSVRH